MCLGAGDEGVELVLRGVVRLRLPGLFRAEGRPVTRTGRGARRAEPIGASYERAQDQRIEPTHANNPGNTGSGLLPSRGVVHKIPRGSIPHVPGAGPVTIANGAGSVRPPGEAERTDRVMAETPATRGGCPGVPGMRISSRSYHWYRRPSCLPDPPVALPAPELRPSPGGGRHRGDTGQPAWPSGPVPSAMAGPPDPPDRSAAHRA